jgi:hypothetical protein
MMTACGILYIIIGNIQFVRMIEKGGVVIPVPFSGDPYIHNYDDLLFSIPSMKEEALQCRT